MAFSCSAQRSLDLVPPRGNGQSSYTATPCRSGSLHGAPFRRLQEALNSSHQSVKLLLDQDLLPSSPFSWPCWGHGADTRNPTYVPPTIPRAAGTSVRRVEAAEWLGRAVIHHITISPLPALRPLFPQREEAAGGRVGAMEKPRTWTSTAGRKCCYPRIAKGRFPRTAKRPGSHRGSNFMLAFLGQQSAAIPGERPMPPRCARGPRPQGPLFWDRKPLLSPYRASRAGRSAHRTLAPSPSCAAQRIQDSGPRGRNFPQKSDKRNASGASHWHFHQLLFSNGDVEIAHFKNNQTQRKPF